MADVPIAQLDHVETLILYLHESDPTSEASRYPVVKRRGNGTGELLGEAGSGFALAMFFLQTGEVFLPHGGPRRHKTAAAEKAHVR
jgi:hypothetical protein